MLLVPNYIDIAGVRTKQVVPKVCKKLLYLKSKDVTKKVWPVRWLLPKKQVVRNLRPAWVSCKGNKKAWLAKVPYNSY